MRVLLTGATGFVGSWVARELVAAGHEVRALVRKTSKLTNIEGLPIERAVGDVLDAASVRRALDGRDAVVHTAGVTDFGADSRRLFEVNVTGVSVVFGAAAEMGVERALLTSSIAAIGGAFFPRVADEKTPSNAESVGVDYLASKYRGERVALDFAARGLSVCAVRPGVVLGPGDIYNSSATTILALARGSLPAYVAGGASFCDVRDVARGHVAALERGRKGETYILGGHNLEIGELVRRVAEMTGVPAPKRMPYAVAYAVAAVSELAARLFGRRAELSRQLVRASALYTFASSAKAERDLGYTIRPFEDSLRDTLRFFIANGRLKPATPELSKLAAP
jgi:dihydroflavonol-4-reductase